MPTYDTPHPIDLAIHVRVGSIDVIAGDRTDTLVTVSAGNPDKPLDRRGAEETRVDFDGQRLEVVGPRPRVTWLGPTEYVNVKVELPTGSRLAAEIAVGGVRTRGRLGATRIKSTTGAVDVDTVGDLWVRTSHGNTTLGTVEGTLEMTGAHGQIRVGSVSGNVLLKSSHGSVEIGDAGGDLEAKLSYGDVAIERAQASVTARTAHGSIQLREVSRGSIDVESGMGQVTVGVRSGVPAWLDLATKYGQVHNELAADGAPNPSEQTVAVRARTRLGDIRVMRA